MSDLRKECGITLSVLDFGPFNDGMRYGGIYKNGDLYVISSEGVGWTITDWDIDKCQKYFGKSSMEILSMIDLAHDGFIDLARLIRVFGSRLESNYWLWLNKLGS
jgi:hypothetical protein